jgi:hypothetical protein
MTSNTMQPAIRPRFQSANHVFEIADYMARQIADTTPATRRLADSTLPVYPLNYNPDTALSITVLKMAALLVHPGNNLYSDASISDQRFSSFVRTYEKPPVRQLRAKLNVVRQELGSSFQLDSQTGTYKFTPTTVLKPLDTDILLKGISNGSPSIQFYYTIPEGFGHLVAERAGNKYRIEGVVPEAVFDSVSSAYKQYYGRSFDKSSCFTSARIAPEVMLPIQDVLGLLPEKKGSPRSLGAPLTSASQPSHARH